MNRNAVLALTVGSTVALAGCTSHNSAGLPPVNSVTATTPAAGTSAPTASGSAAAPSVVTTTAATGSAKPSPTKATSTSTAGSHTPSPVPTVVSIRCLSSHLRVKLKPGGSGAGQIYSQIVFTNTGKRLCTLAGHPGVSYVAGEDGHQVGRSAERATGTIHTVRLPPGG